VLILAQLLVGLYTISATPQYESVEYAAKSQIEDDLIGYVCFGEDTTYGKFILVVEDISKDEPGVRQIHAREAIAGFLGVNVSSESKLTKESKTIITDGERENIFTTDFFKTVETNISQTLQGVFIQSIVSHDGSNFAVFLLSQTNLNEATDLAIRVRDTHEVVSAIGMCKISDLDHSVARDEAIISAQREAVSKVAGMVIVSNTAVLDDQSFHQTISGKTTGLVNSWEVINGVDSAKNGYWIVEISCEVDAGGVYQEYSSFLESIGDPAFKIKANSEIIQQRFVESFKGFGFHIVDEDIGEATDYIIRVNDTFSEHDFPGSAGDIITKLEASLEIVSPATGEILTSIYYAGPVATATGKRDRTLQKEECITKLFRNWQEPLETSIHDFISSVTNDGREIIIRLDSDTQIDTKAFSKLLSRIPGIVSLSYETDKNTMTVRSKYIGRTERLVSMILGEVNISKDPEINSMGKFTAASSNYSEINFTTQSTQKKT
jgi:hypothetical protein